MPTPQVSKRLEVALVVLMVLVVLGLQVAFPIPWLVLGIAVASGVIGGFMPLREGANGLRVFVHIVPICLAVAVRLGAMPIGLQFLALAQCFLLVLGASRSVDLLYWRRRGSSAA